MSNQQPHLEAENAIVPLSTLRSAGLLLGPIIALALLFIPAPEAMPPVAWRMVALTAWMVIWWLT